MLNIKVSDTVHAYDSIEEALPALIKFVSDWYNSDDKQPLQITLTKIEGRAPPALGIYVGDTMKTEDILR